MLIFLLTLFVCINAIFLLTLCVSGTNVELSVWMGAMLVAGYIVIVAVYVLAPRRVEDVTKRAWVCYSRSVEWLTAMACASVICAACG